MMDRSQLQTEAMRVVSVADRVLARQETGNGHDEPDDLVKANQEISGAWNRRLVLALLMRKQKLSRRQIARMTGLRDSTLTYIIRRLQQRGIVIDAGKLDSAGAGRKHSLMAINGAAGHVLGVSIKQGEARLMLQDLAGRRLGQAALPLKVRHLEQVPVVLKQHLDRWTRRIGTLSGPLLGVAAGITGIVDTQRGLVLYSRMFDASGVPLALLLREQFGVDAMIDHDANFAALAEAREGAATDVSDFLYLLVARGLVERGRVAVGAALYLNRTLHRGVHFASGEIDESLVPAALFDLSKADLAVLADPDANLPRRLQRLADGLALILAQLANFVDPAAIVLGGDIALTNRQLLDEINNVFGQRLVPTVERRRVPVVPSPLGTWGISIGAATAAAEQALLTLEW